MRCVSLGAAFSFLILVLSLQYVGAAEQERASDESAIRALVGEFVEAFNRQDAKAAASYWSKDAVYQTPGNDERLSGRKAIEQDLVRVFAKGDDPKLSVTIESIRFVSDTVAIEEGRSRVVRKDGAAAISAYTAVHVKRKGKWSLENLHETELPEGDSTADSFEQLQQLDWMLGEWVDDSDDATIEYSAHWAKNKSFIVRLFKVSAADSTDLEGTQIIGWDPHAKEIRSWVFDSDGGFSEGTWSKKGKNWIVIPHAASSKTSADS